MYCTGDSDIVEMWKRQLEALFKISLQQEKKTELFLQYKSQKNGAVIHV